MSVDAAPRGAALSGLDEVAQTGAGWPKVSKRVRLDLTDPLAGKAEAPSDLIERQRLAPADAEAQTDDLALARRELRERALDLRRQILLGEGVDRGDRGTVLEKVR